MNEAGGQKRGQLAEHAESSSWDHSTHEHFFEYYANASRCQATLDRFTSVRNKILRRIAESAQAPRSLEVVDIGCGAGSQCFLWAEMGHHVHGLDVNQPLVQLARERSHEAGHVVDFRVGSCTQLPWPDKSMDVCLMLELLEHVREWKECISECIRVLKPGGVLFITTSNKLCPIQCEFNLPLYSWYPAILKRHFERLASTTKPELANFAKYPAVNWFSFYQLRSFLSPHQMRCLDRFDLIDKTSFPARVVVECIRRFPLLRWFAHAATSGTILLAFRES